MASTTTTNTASGGVVKQPPPTAAKNKGFSCFPCLGKRKPPPQPSSKYINEQTDDGNGNPLTSEPEDKDPEIIDRNDNFETTINGVPEDKLDNIDASAQCSLSKSTPGGTHPTTSPSTLSMQPVSQPTSSRSNVSSPPPPPKCAFLVSFMVDARGGAMTGSRGSGLRLMIPQGAVESPVRVTCRYVITQRFYSKKKENSV